MKSPNSKAPPVMIMLCLLACLVWMTGCVGFSGNRAAKVGINILGNTITWESTCEGAYNPDGPAECPVEPSPPPAAPSAVTPSPSDITAPPMGLLGRPIRPGSLQTLQMQSRYGWAAGDTSPRPPEAYLICI